MSDQVVKSAKRLASRPASFSTATKSTAKSSKPAAKTARPKPTLKKRTAAEKAPVRKAAPAKKGADAKRGAAARTPSKPVAKGAAKQARPASKTHAATSAKSTKKAAAPAAKTQSQKQKSVPAPAKKSRAVAATTTKPSKPVAPPRPTRPTPAPPRQPTRDEAAALKAFERAHKEFSRGRFTEARNLFRALIEQHAGVAEVTARARTYMAIAEARMRSESALPRDAEALYDRGVIELNRGDYVAAQEMFERALKREPEAPDIHYALAATRARLGAVEPALQSLERALELKPSLRVRVSHDLDFTLLRNEPEYERLLYPPARV
jgi:tetratricopeptide (TPR) repeat protein